MTYGKKSTRTHFTGVGTKLEKGKHGEERGYYHGTNVASKDRKGNMHFRTGGYLTNTTVRRMQSFAHERGVPLSFSRAKGTLSARHAGTGKEYRSGEKRKGYNTEHMLTYKSDALKKKMK